MHLPDRVVDDVATELLKRGSGGGDEAGQRCVFLSLSGRTYSTVRINGFSIWSEDTLA